MSRSSPAEEELATGDLPSVVVLGADGQVGHALARSLAPLGVRALRRAECDLECPSAAAAVIRRLSPRVVVNAAAYTAVDRAEDEPERAQVVNADAPGALAAACAGHAAFVHLSTDYVFDGRKQGPYTEADAAAPVNVYGRTKLAGEQAVAAATPAHLVFRTSWVYDPARGHNFVRTIRRLAVERAVLDVVDDQVGTPTYAVVLAAGLAQVVGAALRAPEGATAWAAARAGVYHLVGEGATSWFGFAGAIVGSLPPDVPRPTLRPVTSHERPSRAVRPANSRLDAARVADVFGLRLPDWQAQFRLALGS